jgi:hypothetical protein
MWNSCQLPEAGHKRIACNNYHLLNLSIYFISLGTLSCYQISQTPQNPLILGTSYTIPFIYLFKDKEVECRKSVFYYPFNSVQSNRDLPKKKDTAVLIWHTVKNITFLHK